MKKSYLHLFALMAVLTLFSCEKEVPPELVISVVDEQDQPINFAFLRLSVDRSNQGVVIPEVIDSTKTNEFGRAFFEFSNTVLVDVGLYESENTTEKIDSISVFLETKRSRDKDSNVTERKMVYRL